MCVKAVGPDSKIRFAVPRVKRSAEWDRARPPPTNCLVFSIPSQSLLLKKEKEMFDFNFPLLTGDVKDLKLSEFGKELRLAEFGKAMAIGAALCTIMWGGVRLIQTWKGGEVTHVGRIEHNVREQHLQPQ